MSTESDIRKFVIDIPIEEKIGVEQKGTIKVGSQIISQLSKGVYSTPAMALKELISNAYDADASEVTIQTKSSGNSLIIHDNGHGMDYKDFDEKFAYISKSPKVDEDAKSKIYKRPIIGRLGIGFIAVSTLCDTMIVSSTTDDSDTKFVAVLDFSKFKRSTAKDLDFYEISEYKITLQPKKKKEKGYTHIELRDLETPFRNILSNKAGRGAKSRNLSKNNFDAIVRKMWNVNKLFRIGKEYGPYWDFVMSLASIVPVEYMKEGPITDKDFSEKIKPLKEKVKDLHFKLFFDGMQLKKPYLFPTNKALETGNYSIIPIKEKVPLPRGGEVAYEGYVYSQDGGINVDDWRGLVVRVKNTGIGTRSQNFLDYPGLSDSMYFKWTFGEIYVTKGLNDAMNIDRATFKLSNSEYAAFADSLHKKLQEVVFESVQKRWRARVKQEKLNVEGYKEKWRNKSLLDAFNKKFEFIEEKNAEFPITISREEKQVITNSKHDLLEFFPRKESAFLKDVLFADAVAREKYPTNPIKQEDFFIELLWNLGEKYPKVKLKYDRKASKSNQ